MRYYLDSNHSIGCLNVESYNKYAGTRANELIKRWIGRWSFPFFCFTLGRPKRDSSGSWIRGDIKTLVMFMIGTRETHLFCIVIG